MNSRRRQQIGGLLIALVGAGMTLWSWFTVPDEGYFYHKGIVLFPAFFVLGVALIVFPGYKEERMARGEDISGMKGWRLITPRWWVIILVALVAGGLNFLLRFSS